MPAKKKNSKPAQLNAQEKHLFFHGTLPSTDEPLPKCVVHSKRLARPGHRNKQDSSEYLDQKNVLSHKMKMVADLIKKSKNFVIYTGAGISVSAGIADYASRSKDTISGKRKTTGGDPLQAQPTYAHKMCRQLVQTGYCKRIITQNHDALFQKAGIHQEMVNEIHGSIWDPSGPVVQFWESLREDNLTDLTYWAQYSDLVLVLGTSLSGMTADCVVEECMHRFQHNQSLGTVIVNLQKTDKDSKHGSCPVRVWGLIDDCMRLLGKHLYGTDKLKSFKKPKPILLNKFLIPYNEQGKVDKQSNKRMVLDLNAGAKLQIIHPDSSAFKLKGVSRGRMEGNHILMQFQRGSRRLGIWWLNMLRRGEIEQLPICNVRPKFETPKKKKKKTPPKKQ